MPAVVLLIIVLIVAFLLAKSIQDARARSAAGTSNDDLPAGSGHPSRLRRRSPRPHADQPATPAPPIDEDALAVHVTRLREAVTKGLISDDEAVASVVRHTNGGLSDEAARKLLAIDDQAA